MRTSFARVAITLISINAVLAIVVLLGGEMGRTEGRILATSLLATGTALLVMLVFPAMADRRIGIGAHVAIGGAVVGFGFTNIAMWGDMDVDAMWRIAVTGYTLAGAGTIASILAGFSIAGRSAWVGKATLIALGVATAMLLVEIWGEVGNDGYWRTFSVVVVLIAAGGLAIPVLNRSAHQAETLEMAVAHCPFCGSDVGGQMASDVTCAACGNRFGVSLHAVELARVQNRAGV